MVFFIICGMSLPGTKGVFPSSLMTAIKACGLWAGVLNLRNGCGCGIESSHFAQKSKSLQTEHL